MIALAGCNSKSHFFSFWGKCFNAVSPVSFHMYRLLPPDEAHFTVETANKAFPEILIPLFIPCTKNGNWLGQYLPNESQSTLKEMTDQNCVSIISREQTAGLAYITLYSTNGKMRQCHIQVCNVQKILWLWVMVWERYKYMDIIADGLKEWHLPYNRPVLHKKRYMKEETLNLESWRARWVQ